MIITVHSDLNPGVVNVWIGFESVGFEVNEWFGWDPLWGWGPG